MFYYTYKAPVNRTSTKKQPTFEELMSNTWEVPTTTNNTYMRQSTMQLESISTEFFTKVNSKVNRFIRNYKQILDRWAEEDMSQHYRHFTIPKASGGERPIDAPTQTLKIDLQTLTASLQYNCSPEHSAAYAYVKHRNHAASLEHHQKREHYWYLKMDLHDFFGSCTEEVIRRELTKIPFFYVMDSVHAEEFTKLIHVATLNGKLPQGSPLSPWLTNQIMIPFDYAIYQTCKFENICYTRYADDMLFSANHKMEMIPAYVENLLPQGFTLNTDKTHLSSIAGKNWNLGLMINRKNNITVGNKQKEIFRARLTEFCHEHHTFNKSGAQQLYGMLAYYKQIEPDYFNNLLTKYGQKFNIDIETKLKQLC